MASATTTKKKAPKKAPKTKAERTRKALLSRREGGFEIGKPKLTSYQRKEGVRLRKLCDDSLLEFNKIFKNSTGLKPMGSIQIESIEHDQAVILGGGRVNKAEPRGYGKTARARHAVLWAALNGYRKMVPVFKASADKAKEEIIESWKTEIRGTPQLLWMFPDLIWPLLSLQGVGRSAVRQEYKGELTHCKWTSTKIVLPTVKGEEGASSVLMALALKSARGANHTTPSGKILRPELLFFDDVQTDEDADNPVTLDKMEDLIDHTAMRLGGHSKTLAAIMCNTIRRENDLGERYQKKQGWQAVRYKMLEHPSDAEESFWMGPYKKTILGFDKENAADALRAAKDGLKLYKKNRKKADAGAVATWDWGYAWEDNPQTEISAVQHAYNIRILEGESVFQCECQNQPLRDDAGIKLLNHGEICLKQGAYPRGVCPNEASVVVSFVDVHPQILDYEVWAFDQDFTGWKIDGGTFPDQRRPTFNHKRPPIPLERLFPGLDDGPRTWAALRAIYEGIDGPDATSRWEGLARRRWQKPSGEQLGLAMGLSDANGRESTEIRAYLTNSPFGATLKPSFGKGLGISDKPISQWSLSFKGNYGPEWVPTQPKSGETPGVIFDANYWKTMFHRKLSMAMAAKGGLYLWKTDDPKSHTRSAHGYLAESPKAVTDGVREVLQWKLRPNQENHPLDCAVGCLVAASMAGIRPAQRKKKKKKRVSMAEKIAQAQRASK